MLRSVPVVLFSLLISTACTGQSSAQTVEHVLRQKTARLKARDPGKEAASAATRGDSRLAATNYIGPMPSGWSLPGVSCARSASAGDDMFALIQRSSSSQPLAARLTRRPLT